MAPAPRLIALGLALLLGWCALLGPARPGAGDPVQRLGPQGAQVHGLRLQLLEDPRPDASGAGCRALAQLPGGRSELLFRPCPPLQLGWLLRVDGRLRRPRPAPHPLLAGPAERLQRQGVWTQLRVQRWQVLGRPATPIADLRRRMAAALLQAGGPAAGGVLAALVLGSAVVPLPLEVREAFRASGLSHALAASGLDAAQHPLGSRLVNIGQHHPGAFCGQQHGAGLAEAAAPTGDEGHLVLNALHTVS